MITQITSFRIGLIRCKKLYDWLQDELEEDESEEACRWRLLEHVQSTQDLLDERLQLIDEQVTGRAASMYMLLDSGESEPLGLERKFL